MGYKTVSDIVKETRSDRARVGYAIERARIEPTARVGTIRLFTVEQAEEIKRILMSIREQQSLR